MLQPTAAHGQQCLCRPLPVGMTPLLTDLRGKPGATKASGGGAGWTHGYFYPKLLHPVLPSILSSRTVEDLRTLRDTLKGAPSTCSQFAVKVSGLTPSPHPPPPVNHHIIHNNRSVPRPYCYSKKNSSLAIASFRDKWGEACLSLT